MLSTRREFLAAVLAANWAAAVADAHPVWNDARLGFLRVWSRFRHWRLAASLQIDRDGGVRFRHVRAAILSPERDKLLVIADLEMPLLRRREYVMVPSDYATPASLQGEHAVDFVVEEALLSLLFAVPPVVADTPAMSALACLITERMLVGPDGEIDDRLSAERRDCYERYGDGLRLAGDINWRRFCDDGHVHGGYRDG